MLLRVLRERWNADDTPMLDESRPHRPQLVNGGSVVVTNPATGLPENFLPGELLDVPDKVGKDLLANSPQSVEPESHHQARLGRFRARDAERESERTSLAARMREMGRETEQAQKLRHMAEERERVLAAENLRVAQNSAGKDSLISEMRAQMAAMQATYEAKLAELAARITAPAAEPDLPAEKTSRKKAAG